VDGLNSSSRFSKMNSPRSVLICVVPLLLDDRAVVHYSLLKNKPSTKITVVEKSHSDHIGYARETKMPSGNNHIYVIVVYSLNDAGEPNEMHNHGWFAKLSDAKEYMKFAGTPAPEQGGDCFWEDPFEQRWTHVMIERVSEGVMCRSEPVANYKAEFYSDPDYTDDPDRTELANAMRRRRVRAIELPEPPFDTSGSYGFAGF
jgi:hypothetical protein